ncbi:MAG: hypothetical protein LQ352_004845 [Teloschistes flavicans]|nr:MAG: hypothetical protein LQ352_004845 [Teloschistes flavicans]
MPHATDLSDAQGVDDDLLIRQALDLANPLGIPLEIGPGEKAENAVDYADLADDDLADEEDFSRTIFTGEPEHDVARREVEGLIHESKELETDENGTYRDDMDELFGEIPQSPSGKPSAPKHESGCSPEAQLSVFEEQHQAWKSQDGDYQDSVAQFGGRRAKTESSQLPTLQALNAQKVSKEEQMQRYLISMSAQGAATLDGRPESGSDDAHVQDLGTLWPKFEQDSIPRFMDLLPHKKTHYIGKKPLKQPKPVHPTKLNLDLALDQEKQFRRSSGPNRRPNLDEEGHAIVRILPIKYSDEESIENSSLLSDCEDEIIGGATWHDLQVICEDWDNHSFTDSAADGSNTSHNDIHPDMDNDRTMGHSSNQQWYMPPAKRRKIETTHGELLHSRELSLPPLQDPEDVTSRIADSVTLDLNDIGILVERIAVANHFAENPGNSKVKTRAPMSQRYNISNDEAYDLLKENHQSKIRSNLGNPQVDHSLPATRLQWPYYKTKLEKQEARSFHRPMMSFHRNEKILFNKPRYIKKKHFKGKDTRSLFGTTHDLSLSDNSNALLLEYSEEFPTMMSNFGMASKIINYYRRRSAEDSSRPKLDIGETNLLMPQDKSPFSTFGHIDPGEVCPALYNGMYKAPLFPQDPKHTDFLVIRNTTGVSGPTWYIRPIEHLRVVGQEFPSVDVPGPHSRKVTTAAKNRLKMISYRLLRKSKTHKIKVSAVTRHFTDSTDMQNRQKMKEFMQFDKGGKEWEMRSGEAIPDEETIRSMVKPEDVCLLESMQVGQQHLQDAGFGKGDDDAEGDAANLVRGIEQLLAPWFTTRNFLNAVQGKAMLELHGDGDPSGRGEAFSFIKTSMKGGFKAMGESVEDRLDAKKLKELGGHSYNVARQQRSYEESIRRIWEAQKQSLSSMEEQRSDTEKDDESVGGEDDQNGGAATPRSEAQTPASARHRDDETMSQASKFSSASQAGKTLKITRQVRTADGSVEEVQETIRNPRVIRHYLKRKRVQEVANIESVTLCLNTYLQLIRGRLKAIRPTGDAATDRRNYQVLAEELTRLERNQDRRLAREKQKSFVNDDAAQKSPDSPTANVAVPVKTAGTQRKCANCGQVGHIKTNKKYHILFF